jgi:hypothetical protein
MLKGEIENMRRIILTTLFLFISLAAVMALMTSCGDNTSADSIKITPEVEGLIAKFDSLKAAGIAGDEDTFWRLRDSFVYFRVKEQDARLGAKVDSARLANWVYNWPVIDSLPLIQDTAHGNWRRLVFRREGLTNAVGEEMVSFPIIMYHMNADGWRVHIASSVRTLKVDDYGNPARFEDVELSKMFGLPPSGPGYESLKEQEGAAPVSP